MEIAIRYCRGQKLITRNVNYIEEIEDLRHQINLLKLGLSPDPVNAITLPLNRPYENQRIQTPSANTAFRCFNCNGVGHMKRDCPNPPKRGSNQNDNNNNRNPNNNNGNRGNRKNFKPTKTPCPICNRHGHWGRDCWNNPKNANNTPSP